MKDNTKFFITTIFIIIAFFLGYLLHYLQVKSNIEEISSTQHFITVEELKTKYKITSQDKNTYIFYDNQKLYNLDIKK